MSLNTLGHFADFPDDHVHCNTAGEPLESDVEYCDECMTQYMAGDECICPPRLDDELRTRWYAFAGAAVIATAMMAAIWR